MMKSRNFKKALSASIASLTVLSTLGSSISTKIYAGESNVQGNVDNDTQRNFIACSYKEHNFVLQYDSLLQDESNKELVNQFVGKLKEIMADRPFDKDAPKNKTIIREFENVPNTYGIMREFLSITTPEEQKEYLERYLECVLGMDEEKQQAIEAGNTPVEVDFYQEMPELTEPSENTEESTSKPTIETEPVESDDEEVGTKQTSTLEFLYNGYLYLIVADQIPHNSPEGEFVDTFFRLENDVVDEYYKDKVTISPTKGFVFHVFDNNSGKELMQIISSNQSDEAKKLAIKDFLNKIGAEAEKHNFEITNEKLIQKLKEQGINDINEYFKTEEKNLRVYIEQEKIKRSQEVAARANTPVDVNSYQEVNESSESSENTEESKVESNKKTNVEEHKATEENQKPQATTPVEDQSKKTQTNTDENKNSQPSVSDSSKETKTEKTDEKDQKSEPAKKKVSLWKRILNFFKKIPLIGKVFKFFFK